MQKEFKWGKYILICSSKATPYPNRDCQARKLPQTVKIKRQHNIIAKLDKQVVQVVAVVYKPDDPVAKIPEAESVQITQPERYSGELN